jgi:hypothetical protein
MVGVEDIIPDMRVAGGEGKRERDEAELLAEH